MEEESKTFFFAGRHNISLEWTSKIVAAAQFSCAVANTAEDCSWPVVSI